MFPGAFIKRLENQEYIDSGLLLKALSQPSPASIRINVDKWRGVPAVSVPVPWCSNGWHLPSRPSYISDPLFHAGCYYPQESSSMFLEQIFLQLAGNIKNIKVLDLCGAPGGKSTHLSSIIGSNGFLVSNEVIRSRAMVLAENLTKWGLSNFIVTQSDPGAFGRLPGFFDIILVDAPCSGEGMFRDRTAVEEWSEENAFLCAERQKRILMDVWPALKEGGILIYSTCTFNPAENEENLRWLVMNRKAETLRLEITEGITEIDYEGLYGYGFHPGKVMGDGLFYAAVRKLEHDGMKKKQNKESRAPGITGDESREAARIGTFSEESLYRRGDEILSLPCSIGEYQLLRGAVKTVIDGTSLFTVRKNGFVPSHELAMSVRLKDGVYPTADLGFDDAVAYLRKENLPSAVVYDRGWNLLRYKGASLGFVNNLGTRLNNYYPVEWRIRKIGRFEESGVILWK